MEIQKFNHPRFGELVTLFDENGETWFMGKEVAVALGYSGPHKALYDHVEERDCKVLTYKASNETVKAIIWHDNDFSNKLFINESGLYSLILSSKLPHAQEFKHWVTSEVLPAIRQSGCYMIGDSLMQFMQQPEVVMHLCRALVEVDQQRLEAEQRCLRLDQRVQELEIAFPDEAPADGYHTVTAIAREVGMSAIALNKFLRRKKVQYRKRRVWILADSFQAQGLTYLGTTSAIYSNGRGHASMRWTEKGRSFILKLIEENMTPNEALLTL